MDSLKKLILTVAALVTVVIVAFAVITKKDTKSAEFVPPAVDTTEIIGEPENIDRQTLYYTECKLSEELIFALCGKAPYDGDKVDLYFTSYIENKAYVRIVALDDGGNEIGTTGLIQPGYYVPSISLTQAVDSGSLTIKIITYEPETFYSMGTATATIALV